MNRVERKSIKVPVKGLCFRTKSEGEATGRRCIAVYWTGKVVRSFINVVSAPHLYENLCITNKENGTIGQADWHLVSVSSVLIPFFFFFFWSPVFGAENWDPLVEVIVVCERYLGVVLKSLHFQPSRHSPTSRMLNWTIEIVHVLFKYPVKSSPANSIPPSL